MYLHDEYILNIINIVEQYFSWSNKQNKTKLVH